MSAREFVDTNVLIYAHDDADLPKRGRARELVRRLLRERNGVLSVQVLQSFSPLPLASSACRAIRRVSTF